MVLSHYPWFYRITRRVWHSGGILRALTWGHGGLHVKPCGILNVFDYYSPLVAMFDAAVEERFVKPQGRALVLARESPRELFEALEEWRAVPVFL